MYIGSRKYEGIFFIFNSLYRQSISALIFYGSKLIPVKNMIHFYGVDAFLSTLKASYFKKTNELNC